MMSDSDDSNSKILKNLRNKVKNNPVVGNPIIDKKTVFTTSLPFSGRAQPYSYENPYQRKNVEPSNCDIRSSKSVDQDESSTESTSSHQKEYDNEESDSHLSFSVDKNQNASSYSDYLNESRREDSNQSHINQLLQQVQSQQEQIKQLFSVIKNMNNKFDDKNMKDNQNSNYDPDKTQKYDFGDLSNIKLSKKKKSYPEVIRIKYEEHPIVKALTDQQAQIIRDNNHISVTSKSNCRIPNPISRFETEIFPDYIMKYIQDRNFKNPTPIQMQTWPIILSCCDVLAIAETGSGKTLAFLIPAFLHVLNQRVLEPDDGPICLVLSPTRELSIQIAKIAGELCAYKKELNIVNVHCSYGGFNRSLKREYHDFIAGKADILVASPGRLWALLNTNLLDLNRVSILVIDEADRMLDEDSKELTEYLARNTAKDRQTLFFSAVWHDSLDDMTDKLSNRPLFEVSTYEEKKFKPVNSIEQVIYRSIDNQIRIENKIEVIKNEIINLEDKSTIIFCESRKDSNFLTSKLEHSLNGLRKVGCLHGGHDQSKRNEVMKSFKDKIIKVLVTTDVLSRGIDVPSVGLVINYMCPSTIETYINRVGRTGRSGRKGRSVIFIDTYHLPYIERIMEVSPNVKIVEC